MRRAYNSARRDELWHVGNHIAGLLEGQHGCAGQYALPILLQAGPRNRYEAIGPATPRTFSLHVPLYR
jgi:hypothetical protein